MAKGVRSARGVMVDFDLLRIKENLGAVPKASTVKAREEFIDNKFKRKLRRMAESAVATDRPAAPFQDVSAAEPVTAPASDVDNESMDSTPAIVPITKKKVISN